MKKRIVPLLTTVLIIMATTAPMASAANTRKGNYADGYEVTFCYNNGGSVSVAIYLNINGAFTIVDAPKYAGYTFVGWSCGGRVYQPGEVINVSRDMRFEATWVESIPARNPFTDIYRSDAYFDAVMYVYEKGIMAGTSATTFSPNDPVTRAAGNFLYK